MGLFSQQPEQDDEWAGIPSEPLRPESQAERLTDAAPIDASSLGVAGLGAGGLGFATFDGLGSVESVVIPVVPVIETAQVDGSGDDAD